MMKLSELKNELAFQLFGMIPEEAHVDGICISCKQPTDVLDKEYRISAIGTCCQHEFFKEIDDA